MPRNRLIKLHRQHDGAEIFVNFDLVILFFGEGTGTQLLFSPGHIFPESQLVSEPPETVLDLAERA